MKDYIDERNRKEQMAHSIIKRRNVVYMNQEEIVHRMQMKQEQEKVVEQDEAERLRVEEVLRNMEEEQHHEEQMIQAEIDALLIPQNGGQGEDGPEISESELELLLSDSGQEKGQEPEE